ncbi:hypothetical protein MPSEU_000809100 [Mayamaea pseudoterrestris]|nr:hypothetical protein MPSEU_000809100 [Mayamaea pseudoterrestris]
MTVQRLIILLLAPLSMSATAFLVPPLLSLATPSTLTPFPIDLPMSKQGEAETINGILSKTNKSHSDPTFIQALNPYRSPQFASDREYLDFLISLQEKQRNNSAKFVDPFWEQIKLEAAAALEKEPGAGPQLYQGILGRSSLKSAISSMVSHEIETELIPATALKGLMLELLTIEDEMRIRLDLQAVATRSAGIRTAMDAVLFHNGFHALVCYRVGHRLWQAGRTGLAYYLQSVVSRRFSADIHPACRIGSGCYIRGSGCVIGETAVVGNDVSIFDGVTLGGTGKEAGDRHPKIGNGVIIGGWAAVLGNIPVGDGAVVDARSIVTKPVPPLARVSGVPARIQGYRSLDFNDVIDKDLEAHLAPKYFEQWKQYESLDGGS